MHHVSNPRNSTARQMIAISLNLRFELSGALLSVFRLLPDFLLFLLYSAIVFYLPETKTTLQKIPERRNFIYLDIPYT